MESVRRSEANSCHHPNKVAINSLPTESNKHASGSVLLNNNKLGINQQQVFQQVPQKTLQQIDGGVESKTCSLETSSSSNTASSSPSSSSSSSGVSNSSESKDTNFEYDDNEWDVGGIGDLIIDLDADIEKSSSTAATVTTSTSQQQQSQDQSSSQALIAIPGVVGADSISSDSKFLNAYDKSCSPVAASASSKINLSSSQTLQPASKSTLSSLLRPISAQPAQQLISSQQYSSAPKLGSDSSSTLYSADSKPTAKSSSKSSENLKASQTTSAARFNSGSSSSKSSSLPPSKVVNPESDSNKLDRNNKSLSGAIAAMSSQQGSGTGAGKTAAKMSIDHQATLDKGLKMKIKRTKPGTKTSEAKHEIVKAEQNGNTSNLEENSMSSSNNSSSSSKKHTQMNATSSSSAQQSSIQSTTATTQSTKRGSSSHRRDKTRDKVTHARDKVDHSSSSTSSSSNNGSSSGSNSSSLSSSTNSNNSSGTERSSGSSCNCHHDMQVNGVQTTTAAAAACTNVSCSRNRTGSGTLDSSSQLAQRISTTSSTANQSNNTATNTLGVNSSSSSSSSSSLQSNANNSGTTSSSSVFTSSNSASGIQTSNSSMPNAPGPPKDSKLGSSSAGSTCGMLDQSVSSLQACNSSSNSHSIQQQSESATANNTAASPPIIGGGNNQNNNIIESSLPLPISATVHHTISVPAASAAASSCNDRTGSPPTKKLKCDSKDMIDICVGTSVGTVTEPDCLGPCEPGTSVTLEGIVWHETEGGVLVVNVTWRGKTYVGTLLDCTRHDWAPPRFCDSPTEELDARNMKGRGKRGRSATLAPDLSNFTETRSSVHSKLRNGGAKGRGGRGVSSSTTSGPPATTTTSTISTAASNTSCNASCTTTTSTPSTSPTAFLHPRTEKRKSKEDSPSPVNVESPTVSAPSLVNPVTGLNVQISSKRCRTTSPSAVSPVLLECPEQDCSKKYKHANGLRYHQSHAHGSNSMDEDSLQLPESPRIAPPTTPSPAPAPVTTTTTIAQSKSAVSNACVGMTQATAGSLAVSSPPSIMSVSSSPTQLKIASATTAAINQSAELAPNIRQAAGAIQLQTTGSSTVSGHIPSQQIPQLPVPGGSITSGISGQALSQHQQQNTMISSTVAGGGNSIMTSQPISGDANQSLIAHSQQPQQLVISGGGLNVADAQPRPPDPQIKPSVLCFGSPSDNMLAGQDSIRPTPTSILTASTGSSETLDGPPLTHQSAFSQAASSVQQGISASKQQGVYAKQRKNRSKSPNPGDFDNPISRDNVQSPAYSDISDDSTPVADSELIDNKSQPAKHTDAKKSQESAPPPIASLGGYGMYQFYPQQQYMVPSDVQQAPKPSVSQSPMPLTSPAEYTKSSKDPPLDLMTTKSAHTGDQQTAKESIVVAPPPNPVGPPAVQNPSKPMPYFYPHNYMTAGYPYNIDSNYGPISMVAEDNKFTTVMKEERTKESPSPNEHGKLQGPSKLLKTEPQMKEIKTEPNPHIVHAKEPAMNPYPSIYPRHSMGPSSQPPQHLSREDDVRRFYMYSDQRRSNMPGNPLQSGPPISIKDEPPSQQQQHSMQHSSQNISQIQQQQQMPQHLQSASNQSQTSQSQSLSSSQQQQQKCKPQNQPGSQTSSGQKATNLVKDVKEEKDIKIKQEGQKPTMETQGPPPPPTSQYFLHPQYLTPNFSFDPSHPMYRNVLMSASPYTTSPYHLPMPRFHAPEDLSRNPGPKALDVLQQAASTMQYYGSHKIHELSERALKSPNSNANNKTSVSSPNISQQNVPSTLGGPNIGSGGGVGPGGPGGHLQAPGGPPGGPMNLQPPGGPMPPNIGGSGGGSIVGGGGGSAGNGGITMGGGQKNDSKTIQDPSNKTGMSAGGGGNGGDSRSPPPQRHVHTHHHTHVGLGYPMYTAPYGAAVLASQQAAAVAAINPFPPGPNK